MTIRLGIIGWPLIKTFSPNIHQTLSEISNVDITYKKLVVEDGAKFEGSCEIVIDISNFS